MQLLQRVLAAITGQVSAVDHDLGVAVGKKLPRAAGDLFERHAERARNVCGGIGLGRQHVDNGERRVAQPAPEFLARNLRLR